MSMIIICQSKYDLSRYGLKNAYNVGMIHIKSIVNTLDFKGNIWSNDVFCCLYDDSNNYLIQNNRFEDSSVFYFLNEVIDYCDKIAIFYCEPSKDTSTWIICHSKEMLLKIFENVLRKNDISQTIIFSKNV